MRILLLLSLLLIGSIAFSQNVTNHQVEPKGIYKEINLSNDIRVIQLLLDTNAHSNSLLIDSVERDANNYTPPVLYVLSNTLFYQKKYNDACYWFYVAQLRARYDINRCTDKTANASSYNTNFGPIINEYAFHHLDTLRKIVRKVVDFVRTNEELYDQQWINLTGMDAMTASMSDKQVNNKLSIDKSQWPAIKQKTIDDYYSDFKDALGLDNDDTTVDRSNMLGYDYRLFKGTPAWDLAKAVQNEDTIRIKQDVNKNRQLLSLVEPKFGQPLLSLAVKRSSYNSVKTLLELGADPNMQSTYDGSSPLTEACELGLGGFTHEGADSRFLKLLLKYGANPNIVGHSKAGSAYGARSKQSPLSIASQEGNLNYVKILVDAGANVNYNDEFGMNPLGEAVISGYDPDVVIYLIEKGADFKKPIYPATKFGQATYIAEGLRNWRYDLGSDLYKKKMQLVDFLKKNGIDYWKTEIPKQYLDEYPKEYLEKY
ncbi:MAG TPA: ankyrin repeat domain-containing protein [Mucilaginibacter sp.]|nr:ankyrin repeat domain-containing protein [Mucilaginibacter sp.]